MVDLRLAGAVDRDGANAFLAEFLPRCNARFAVPHADPVPAWRPVPAEVRLELVFVFKYPCTVARDTRSGSPGGSSSCRPAAAGAAMPGGWSRSMSSSMARSWPSTVPASWPFAEHRQSQSSCAPRTD